MRNIFSLKKINFSFWILFLSFLTLALAFSSSFLGSGYTFLEVGNYYLSKIPILGPKLITTPLALNIEKVMLLRIPRIILAAVVGAGLSVAGALLQALFRNPLADPYFLGISAGASFGFSLASLLWPFSFGLLGFGLSGLSALVFALLTIFCVYLISRSQNYLDLNNLILAGVAVSAILTSLVTVLMLIGRQRLERIVLTTMGSFSQASFEKLILVVPIVLLGILISSLWGRNLNLFLFGEEHAASLGLKVETQKKLILALASLLTSVCVAASGLIWFVGLIVPHLIRLFISNDNKKLIPLSALSGALLLILADNLARTLYEPHELPIGLLTALLGGPFFLFLLKRYKKSFPPWGKK